MRPNTQLYAVNFIDYDKQIKRSVNTIESIHVLLSKIEHNFSKINFYYFKIIKVYL